MKVFVDTSAFYALASASDRAHPGARTIHEQLKRDAAELLTTNYVVLEAVSLLQRRHGMAEAEHFADFVMEHVDLVWIEEAQHRAAWKSWKQHRQRKLSLVDCSSFVVMRQRGIRHAFAFDQQFQAEGFELVSAPSDYVAEPKAAYRVKRR